MIPIDTHELYTEYRPLLFSIAYRMLGSVMDAEDMIQDTFLALEHVDGERVDSMKSYLCKMMTNRCLDHLKSARKQREIYIGPWLPEPLLTEGAVGSSGGDPLETVMTHDHLSIACLTLIERLSPSERAVFVLREALGFDYEEIADTVGKTPAACRKILSRVKQKLGPDLPQAAPDYERHRDLLTRFVTAIGSGDHEALLSLLAADVTLYSDGGGRVLAAIRPVHSPAHVAAFLFGIARTQGAEGYEIRFADVNGAPGLLFAKEGQTDTVFSLAERDGQIVGVYIVRNPDKLSHL